MFCHILIERSRVSCGRWSFWMASWGKEGFLNFEKKENYVVMLQWVKVKGKSWNKGEKVTNYSFTRWQFHITTSKTFKCQKEFHLSHLKLCWTEIVGLIRSTINKVFQNQESKVSYCLTTDSKYFFHDFWCDYNLFCLIHPSNWVFFFLYIMHI